MDTLHNSNFTGLVEAGAASDGSTYSTGDLRRAYGIHTFGTQNLSSLKINRDPFFRIMTMFRRNPTDDSIFKIIEERPSWHKRYAYITAHGTTAGVTGTADATVTASNIAAGSIYYWKMSTDYKYTGNIGNRYGQSSGAVSVGDAYTRPLFFIPNQVIQVNFGSAFNAFNDFILCKILEVTPVSNTHVILKTEVTKALGTATNNELQWASAIAPVTTTYSTWTANEKTGDNASLESKRTYVVGYAAVPGGGIPETWADQPYSTGFGYCQTWETSLGMDDESRATVLKHRPSEWDRLWGNKLLENKWDISESMYIEHPRIDSDGAKHTQGVIDYALNYGNIFSIDYDNTTSDDFLQHLSEFADPRKGDTGSMVFFCDTQMHNWMNMLSGFTANNANLSPNYRVDLTYIGKSKLMGLVGVDANVIDTGKYGKMKIVHDIHLDNKPVKMVGADLNYCEWRPHIGNGITGETTTYQGVQRLETTGVTKRVDLILTRAGCAFTMPERFAVWT